MPPAQRIASASHSDGQVKAVTTRDVRRTPRILVVDDDPVIRHLVSATLERAGYEVLHVVKGLDALELAALGLAGDAVILDIGLPDIDGRAVLGHLRQSRYSDRLPVIVLTGSNDESLKTAMLDEGADHYLRKPIDPAVLLACVAATLGRSAR